MLRQPLMAVHQTPTTGRRQFEAQCQRVRQGGATSKVLSVVDRQGRACPRPLAVTEC